MSPLNRSTDSIRKWQVVSSEPLAIADGRDRGKCCRLANHVGHRMKALRLREAFEILPAFGLQIARLDQQEPALRRKVVGKVRTVIRSWRRGEGQRAVEPPRVCLSPSLTFAFLLHRSQPPSRQSPPAARGSAGSRPQSGRIDSISSPKSSIRTGLEPVGGKDVDDPAAAGEFAGQFHGGRVLIAVADEPRGDLVQRKRLAGPQRASLLGQPRRLGTGCNKAAMLVTSTLGGCGPSSDLSTRTRSPTASSWTIRSALSDSWTGNRTGSTDEKMAQIADQPLHFVQPRADDNQHGRRGTSSAAAISAQDEPQTPSSVAAWPACRLSTTSAKSGSASMRATSCCNRSHAAVAVVAAGIFRTRPTLRVEARV